jgi:hypothetical protein
MENMNDFNARDLFAGLAMVGMLATKDWFSTGGRWKTEPEMVDTYAKEAYDFADAMLKEKAKRDERQEG